MTRGIVDMIVPVLYFGIGVRLSNEAFRHLRDPRKTHWFTPMLEPEQFTPEGNRLRIRALRFWNWGGGAVLIYFLLLSRLLAT